MRANPRTASEKIEEILGSGGFPAATACCVNEDRAAPGSHDRRLELFGRARNRKRRSDDVGVKTQLFDGAHSKSVGGDQAQADAVPGAFLCCDLRDRRGLPYSWRSDEDFR